MKLQDESYSNVSNIILGKINHIEKNDYAE